MNKISGKRTKNASSAGFALVWVVVITLGLITVLGVGRAIKKQKEQQKQIPTAKTPSGTATPVLDQAREEKEEEEKAPRFITEGPCATDLNSKECEDFVRQQCEDDPYISECLEVFHYAGKIACEKDPQSEDCHLYQEYKNQAQPAAGLPKGVEDLLNQIRTHQPPLQEGWVPDQPGLNYDYDHEDYLYLQEEAQFGHIYEGHPDYQYYQELQQQFGQPELPPFYLNPLNDPNVNPLANPDVNPLMNPDVNPLANPDINPMADPSLNPGCIPCQLGGQQGFGQGEGYGGWGGFGSWGR